MPVAASPSAVSTASADPASGRGCDGSAVGPQAERVSRTASTATWAANRAACHDIGRAPSTTPGIVAPWLNM
eukprot:CAMPEP_0181219816 /NCGR_PEP_ID=MMETSP1096-20121128/28493_1 /TAXON_ID=156174 ORGANISM="Chrysochromulina ericina, Strain CCMP281" /NCGR_SAMPLE_ID=MMETSP1096 /ASSEMBLY_ACC=CAM_ASM_000453 /LENGTH=71 /DNA_ID=CAMNT_0023312253 /DNA_START=765 /DNA_END=980 /DNA_ORIENTATION=-